MHSRRRRCVRSLSAEHHGQCTLHTAAQRAAACTCELRDVHVATPAANMASLFSGTSAWFHFAN